jgi:hypothetical protein
MKKSVTFTDAAGRAHNTPDAATVSDLAGLLINENLPAGAAADIASKFFKRRKDVERIFAEHDEAIQP